MDVVETVLPGVGLRYEFTLANGRRICVIAKRSVDQFNAAKDTSWLSDQCL